MVRAGSTHGTFVELAGRLVARDNVPPSEDSRPKVKVSGVCDSDHPWHIPHFSADLSIALTTCTGKVVIRARML